MAEMSTPPPRVNKRRTVSPLHELDGTERADDNSLSPAHSTPELESESSHKSLDSIARVVRAEIQAAVAPLESRPGNLQSSVDGRLSQVEGMIKTHDFRIGKVEGALDNFLVNGKTMDETTATQVAQIESQLSDLKVQVDAMKVPTHTTASPSHTDTKCTMVVGGLAGLKTLPAASKWLTDTLESLHGPIHTGVYVKSEDFNGLMFAKFRSQLDCDTAVATLRAVRDFR